MAKGYMGETRHYISVIDDWEINADGHRVAVGEPIYIRHDGSLTTDFIEAKHFPSKESAVEFGQSYKKDGRSVVVRSLHLEVIGFDIGTLL